MDERIFIVVLIFSASMAGTSCINNSHNVTIAPSPILVLATQDNFGLYTAEILKTEGFNDFQTDSLGSAQISADFLEGFDIVILAENQVAAEDEKMLAGYVKDGGNLIAFRPDKKLSKLFGITDEKAELNEAYLTIDASTEAGKGITSEALQFHGTADQYGLAGAKAIASLYTDVNTPTASPAVVQNAFGNGVAIAFLYNLPKSIVYSRQGNYQHAGQEMDGIVGVRAMDLFTNKWVDTSRNTLNQADEQMRLLSHCIEDLSKHKRPIPRFWYFPDSLKCLVTLNNDGEDSKESDFVKQFQDVYAKGAKMTLYVKEVEFVSKAWVDEWTRKGFEISGHPDDTNQAMNPDWNTMDSVYKNLLHRLKNNYGISAMKTVTNHWFVWVGKNPDGTPDFAAQAKIESNNGIGLDCNYAHYDNGSSQGHFLGEFGRNQGNFTGSGLPMKFADAKGKIIDVYQQLNNVYDQQYMEHNDQDGYFHAFKGLMDRSLKNEVYSTISVRAHNNEYYFSEKPLMQMLDYAVIHGVPVWTELKLLEFIKVKEEAGFSNLTWSDNLLSFRINSSIKNDNGITCLIPYTYNGKKIKSVINNGGEESYSVKSIKGFEYAWVTVKPGFNYRMEIRYH